MPDNVLTPPRIASETIMDASAAVERLAEIYERNTEFLRNALEAYVGGASLEARVRATYPFVRFARHTRPARFAPRLRCRLRSRRVRDFSDAAGSLSCRFHRADRASDPAPWRAGRDRQIGRADPNSLCLSTRHQHHGERSYPRPAPARSVRHARPADRRRDCRWHAACRPAAAARHVPRCPRGLFAASALPLHRVCSVRQPDAGQDVTAACRTGLSNARQHYRPRGACPAWLMLGHCAGSANTQAATTCSRTFARIRVLRGAAGFVLVGEEARKPVRTSCGRPEGLPNAPIDIANKRFLRMVSSRRNAAGTMHRMGERSYDPHEFM